MHQQQTPAPGGGFFQKVWPSVTSLQEGCQLRPSAWRWCGLGSWDHHHPCLQSRFMRKRGLPILPMKSLGDSGSIMCKPARDNRALSVGRLHRRTFASENGKCRLGCHCQLPAMSSLPTMAVGSLDRPTPVPTTCYGHFVNIPRLWLSADYRCPARNPGLTNEHPEQKRIRDAQASNATKDPLVEHHRARQACAPTTDPARAGKSMAISYILAGRVQAEAVRVALVWPRVLGPPSPLPAITLHAQARTPDLANEELGRQWVHNVQASPRQ